MDNILENNKEIVKGRPLKGGLPDPSKYGNMAKCYGFLESVINAVISWNDSNPQYDLKWWITLDPIAENLVKFWNQTYVMKAGETAGKDKKKKDKNAPKSLELPESKPSYYTCYFRDPWIDRYIQEIGYMIWNTVYTQEALSRKGDKDKEKQAEALATKYRTEMVALLKTYV